MEQTCSKRIDEFVSDNYDLLCRMFPDVDAFNSVYIRMYDKFRNSINPCYVYLDVFQGLYNKYIKKERTYHNRYLSKSALFWDFQKVKDDIGVYTECVADIRNIKSLIQYIRRRADRDSILMFRIIFILRLDTQKACDILGISRKRAESCIIDLENIIRKYANYQMQTRFE